MFLTILPKVYWSNCLVLILIFKSYVWNIRLGVKAEINVSKLTDIHIEWKIVCSNNNNYYTDINKPNNNNY